MKINTSLQFVCIVTASREIKLKWQSIKTQHIIMQSCNYLQEQHLRCMDTENLRVSLKKIN